MCLSSRVWGLGVMTLITGRGTCILSWGLSDSGEQKNGGWDSRPRRSGYREGYGIPFSRKPETGSLTLCGRPPIILSKGWLL